MSVVAVHSASLHDFVEATDDTTDAASVARLARHPDARLRAVVARRPRLEESVLLSLACDRVDAVRARIAWREDLPDEVGRRLLCDGARSVRRAAVRAHPPSIDTMVELVLADRGNSTLFERIRRELPNRGDLVGALTAKHVGHELASFGAFDRKRLRAIRRNTRLLRGIARHGRLDAACIVWLARHRSLEVQEAVAGRADLTSLRRLLIVVLGRQYAAAAIASHVERRFERGILRLRSSRAVRVALIRTTAASGRLRRAARSDVFIDELAAAMNPKSGTDVIDLLLKSSFWAVHEALAGRADLTEAQFHRLNGHPAVQLRLARNLVIPLSVVQR